MLGYVGEWLVSKHAQLWQSLILNILLVVKGGGGGDKIIHCMLPVEIVCHFKNILILWGWLGSLAPILKVCPS